MDTKQMAQAVQVIQVWTKAVASQNAIKTPGAWFARGAAILAALLVLVTEGLQQAQDALDGLKAVKMTKDGKLGLGAAIQHILQEAGKPALSDSTLAAVLGHATRECRLTAVYQAHPQDWTPGLKSGVPMVGDGESYTVLTAAKAVEYARKRGWIEASAKKSISLDAWMTTTQGWVDGSESAASAADRVDALTTQLLRARKALAQWNGAPETDRSWQDLSVLMRAEATV